MSRRARTALIKLGEMCNNDCLFCHARGPKADAILSLREVCRRAMALRELGFERVILSGGEPTEHPRFIEILLFVRRLGLDVGLITNGATLSVPAFSHRLIEEGLGSVFISLHGATVSSHERLTRRRKSFDEVREAIGLLLTMKVEVTISTVVNQLNIGELGEIVELVSELALSQPRRGRIAHRLSLIEPKGRADIDRSLLPDLDDATNSVTCALEHSSLPLRGRGFDGFPRCLEPQGFTRMNLGFFGITHMQETHDERVYAVDHGERAYGRVCDECRLRTSCPGIYAGYLPSCVGALRPLTA